jgi:nucleoside-diphosphate-sugar epimerase
MGWDHVIPQFITRLERGETFSVQGDGTQTRAFCYVSDAVDATVRAALRPEAAGQTFNVGNDEREWSINEVIALLTEVSGRFVTPVYGPPAAGGTTRRAPDITRARRLLGYEPRVPLREGLLETYLWYREAIARGLAAVNA